MSTAAADPTGRFSGRVDDYVKTRPSYPHGVLDVLRERCGLSATSVVGDLGSGTGRNLDSPRRTDVSS